MVTNIFVLSLYICLERRCEINLPNPIICLLQYGNILENSDPSLVFCFMLTYTIATIMLAFALSTLFSRFCMD